MRTERKRNGLEGGKKSGREGKGIVEEGGTPQTKICHCTTGEVTFPPLP